MPVSSTTIWRLSVDNAANSLRRVTKQCQEQPVVETLQQIGSQATTEGMTQEPATRALPGECATPARPPSRVRGQGSAGQGPRAGKWAEGPPSSHRRGRAAPRAPAAGSPCRARPGGGGPFLARSVSVLVGVFTIIHSLRHRFGCVAARDGDCSPMRHRTAVGVASPR